MANKVYLFVYVTGECGLDMPTSRMQDLIGSSLAKWRGVAQRHCCIVDEILEEVIRTERAIFDEGSRVLGVLLRGTDYLAMHPARHPVQPEIKQAVADVGKVFRAGAWSHIFLVTEDSRIIQAFRQAFGDQVHMTSQAPIHGDFHTGNVGFVGNEVNAIIDFDCLIIGSSIEPLAYSAGKSFRRSLGKASRRRLVRRMEEMVARSGHSALEWRVAVNRARIRDVILTIRRRPVSIFKVAWNIYWRDRRMRQMLQAVGR